MPKDRENVQITLSVDIGNTIETKVKGKEGEEKIKHMITHMALSKYLHQN